MSVEGSLALASQLIVSGTTSLSTAGGGAGTMTIGSSNSQQESKLTTNTFNDLGAATVGGSSAVGSSAEIDAVFLNLGNTSGSAGVLNIGDPGSGHAGSVDVSNTTTVNGGSTLKVGGTDSGGTLDTLSITSSGAATVNTKGEMDITATGTFTGSTTVTGTIKAENVNNINGAGVVLDGTGSVGGGSGKLIAEINASFTFVATSSWTILPGNPVGSALNEGKFFVDGPLAVDTALNPGGDITIDPTGTLGGTGSLDEWSTLTWLGGTLGPVGGTTLESAGDLRTGGSNNLFLASDFVNESAFDNLSGTGMLQINPGVTFTNAVGTVELALPMVYCYDPSSSYFINDATLEAQAPSSSPTVIAGNFTNNGTLDVAGGDALTLDNTTFGTATQDLSGTLNLEGDLLLRGAITSSSALVENSGGGTLKIGDAGSGIAGSLALSQGATFSGNVEVTGFGTLTSAASVTNNGTLELDVGAVTGLSSYQQTSGGTLKEHAPYAGGNSALTVTGSAQLAGDVEMDFDGGYQPQSGDAFTVLTAGSIGGHFDKVPADMTADYGSTSVTLTQN